MEIEKKYLIDTIPFSLSDYNYFLITQGYISTEPVIRIRKSNNKYILTVKSKGLMIRDEFNTIITKDNFDSLSNKLEGNLIIKTRYNIPIDNNLTAELDIFTNRLEGLKLVEVEFASEKDANNFVAPDWFGKEVTLDSRYQNSSMIHLENSSSLLL